MTWERARSASLTVSAVISFALLALYRCHQLVSSGAPPCWRCSYRQILILPDARLACIHPAAVRLLSRSWPSLHLGVHGAAADSRAASAYLGGASSSPCFCRAALAFCGVLFEPFSGIAAIRARRAGRCRWQHRGRQRQRKLHRFFVGRVSTASSRRSSTAKDAPKLTGKRELTVLTCRILNYPELSCQT